MWAEGREVLRCCRCVGPGGGAEVLQVCGAEDREVLQVCGQKRRRC